MVINLFLSIVIGGCATVYNPATEQKEFIFITTPAEISIGNAISAQIQQQYKFLDDPEKLGRVREI